MNGKTINRNNKFKNLKEVPKIDCLKSVINKKYF